MSKIIDVDYIYKKEKNIINSIYIYQISLFILFIIFIILLIYIK